MKLIWYRPTNPATRPENSGPGSTGHGSGQFGADAGQKHGSTGWVASALGRKLKSRMNFSYVGVAVAAAWPVLTAGGGNPSPTGKAMISSPPCAGLPWVTSDPSACVTIGGQGNSLYGAEPLPLGRTVSQEVRM